jgi:hypothetical protein
MQIAVNLLCEGTPVHRAAHDHQKIQITIFVGLAACGGTKEQNALGLHSRNDTADDLIHYGGPLG